MTGILNALIAGVSGAVKDTYFNLVSLLLPGNGTNGAQNNTFLDSSSNNFTITRNGNTTQGTFSPFSQTGWGNYFSGTSGQYLNTTANAAFNFGTGDFTIETWVFPTTTSGTRPIIEIRTTTGSTGFALLSQSGATTVNVFTNGGFVGASTNSLTTNAWNHVALTRSGNTWTYWINGVSGGSFSNSSTQSDGATTGPKIGGSTTVGEVWIGYISNVRIIKGQCLFNGTFTPSVSPLTTTSVGSTGAGAASSITGTVSLLTCQSNRFLDNSGNAFDITVNGSPTVVAFSPFAPTAAYSASAVGGSGYFDGTGDYLSVANNAALSYGTGAFTIEGFFYTSATSQYGSIFSDEQSPGTAGLTLLINQTVGNGQLALYGNGSLLVTATGKYNDNAWHHFAISRDSTNLRLYVDGAYIGASASGSTNFDASQPLLLMSSPLAGRTISGYLSNFRTIKGTALYTGTSFITVPTAPLTAITNTSLLLNFTNAGITDATAKNDLETVGNAQISTSVSKFGGGSIAFDGSGDRLYQPSNQNYNFGTGDFTIEFWAYPTSQGGHGSANNDCLIDFRPGTNGVYGTLYIYTNGTGVYYFVNSANRITGAAISNNTWTHIALCRASGNTRLFLNGTQSGSTYTDANNYLVAPITIGEFNDGTGGGNFAGYIDDLRITKGYARYTSNFTAPTAPFPVQ